MKIAKFIFTAATAMGFLIILLAITPIGALILPALFISKKLHTKCTLFLTALIYSLGKYPISPTYAITESNGYSAFLTKLRLHFNIYRNRIIGALSNEPILAAIATNKPILGN